MKKLEISIKDLLIGCPPIKIVTEEDMEEFGEIVDAHRDISYGQVEVNDEGKMISLVIDLEAITDHNDVSLDEYEELSIEDIKEMGEDFANEFGAKNLQLTSFNDWGSDTFLLIYEAIDVQYQIPLPDSGVTLEMNRQGFVLSATINQSYYQLKYPEVKITAEEALEIYKKRQLVEMGAIQQDEEMRLMYFPINHNQGVSVEGEFLELDQFSMDTPSQLKEISEVSDAYTEQQLLGIHEGLIKTDEDGLTTYKDPENEAVEITINRSDDTEIVIDSSLPFNDEVELNVEEMQQRAIAFLQLQVGEVENNYKVEAFFEEDDEEEEIDDDLTPEEIEMLQALAAEDDDDEDEEEDEEQFEPFVSFVFHRQIKGIPIREYNAHVDIGIYSGTVRDSLIPLLDQKYIEEMEVEPIISIEEADEMYKNSIKMELTRVPHEEEEFIAYELCYVVKPITEPVHIERIDAQNGNVFYLDDLSYVEEVEEDEEFEEIEEVEETEEDKKE